MRDFLDRDYTHKLLGCAYAVHSALGPGLLESIYEKALCYELQSQGFEVRNQVPVKVKYRDISLDMNLQLDMIVDNSVILELKSVTELLPVHKKQLLTYMRLTGTKLGYIINFNEYSLKDGIERIVNDFW
jgi:GxxExxY protein